jgi:alpha-tubulin suppressor-like RCC1 family protein
MNTKLWIILTALAVATCIALPAAADDLEFKSETFPLERNLAVDIAAPGAVRAEIGISIPSLREDLRFELGVDREGQLSGGVYIPPGESAAIEVVAFDGRGAPIYRGEGKAEIGTDLTDEFRVPLAGQESQGPLYARFGSQLLTAGIVGGTDELLQVGVTLLDPHGQVQFSPEDLEWKLPDGFPEIRYSCFNDSLCILEWKPTREQEALAMCLKVKPYPCFTGPVPDHRGPYKYVAVGQNHTCALTVTNEIRCWGDNVFGQLGAPSPSCGQRNCSLVPIAVQCPAGEVCKFRALAAGGDHTCAVDTNGKAWCWGEDGSAAAGSSSFPAPNHTHRRTAAFTDLGVPANFVAIDTDFGHTCAVSAAQDVFCWGANFSGQLGAPLGILTTSNAQLVRSGNRYKSVTTGMSHSCAVQANNGLVDCWGDNADFQLTGNVNSSTFLTINSRVPLASRGVQFMAAGATTTCAQVANDDTVCWGKPSHGSPIGSASQGFVALTASYARSMATDLDHCNGFQNCARICIADLGGELSCGHWKAGTSPSQLLSKVPDPQGVVVISWTQVDVGPNHVCAVTTRQDVWCFGDNSFGQFGTGVFSNNRTDVPVTAANR